MRDERAERDVSAEAGGTVNDAPQLQPLSRQSERSRARSATSAERPAGSFHQCDTTLHVMTTLLLAGKAARQHAIADGLSELAGPELRKGKRRSSSRGASGRSGTQHERLWTDHEGRNLDDLEVV